MPEPEAALDGGGAGRCGVLATARRIVVFRALPGLGDLLCWTPAMRALRSAAPDAEIAFVGLPSASWVLDRFPSLVDRLVEFPGWPGLPEGDGDAATTTAFLGALQAERFDLAIQMHGSGLLTNPLVALFGARRTAVAHLPGGYVPDPELAIAYPSHAHEIHRHLVLTSALGAPDLGDGLTFPVSERDEEEVASALTSEDLHRAQVAVLHPGASHDHRCWPPERFAAVADALHERGLRVVLTGVESERPVTTTVAAACRNPVTDLTGRTSLGALAALVAHAHVVVCNDTGISHLAAALRTPSVVVFTHSDPTRWAPLATELHRAVVDASVEGNRCSHAGDSHRCLGDGCLGPPPRPSTVPVTPDDVVAQVDALLAPTRPRGPGSPDGRSCSPSRRSCAPGR